MTYRLSSKDIWALSCMAFALFVGTGNIIPPMVDLQAGEHVWRPAAGFLLTAMGPDTYANTVFIRGLA